MIYRGRIVGIGRTEKGEEAIVYAVSGRSPPSQYRRLEKHSVVPGVVRVRCFIPPHVPPEEADKIRQQQEADRPNIEYSAIMAGKGVIVVSNGKQTDTVYSYISIVPVENHEEAIDTAMSDWGPERDREHTPRIAGVVDDYWFDSFLSIIVKDGKPLRWECNIDEFSEGRFEMLSTYAGKEGTPNIVLPVEWNSCFTLDLHGATAQELAENLYRWLFKNSAPEGMDMDTTDPLELQRNFAVGAAAVVNKTGRTVDIGIKNKW